MIDAGRFLRIFISPADSAGYHQPTIKMKTLKKIAQFTAKVIDEVIDLVFSPVLW